MRKDGISCLVDGERINVTEKWDLGCVENYREIRGKDKVKTIDNALEIVNKKIEDKYHLKLIKVDWDWGPVEEDDAPFSELIEAGIYDPKDKLRKTWSNSEFIRKR